MSTRSMCSTDGFAASLTSSGSAGSPAAYTPRRIQPMVRRSSSSSLSSRPAAAPYEGREVSALSPHFRGANASVKFPSAGTSVSWTPQARGLSPVPRLRLRQAAKEDERASP